MRGNTSREGLCYLCDTPTNAPRVERLAEHPEPRVCFDCIEELAFKKTASFI